MIRSLSVAVSYESAEPNPWHRSVSSSDLEAMGSASAGSPREVQTVFGILPLNRRARSVLESLPDDLHNTERTLMDVSSLLSTDEFGSRHVVWWFGLICGHFRIRRRTGTRSDGMPRKNLVSHPGLRGDVAIQAAIRCSASYCCHRCEVFKQVSFFFAEPTTQVRV